VKIFVRLRSFFCCFWFSVITWCHECTNVYMRMFPSVQHQNFIVCVVFQFAQNWIKNLFGLEWCNYHQVEMKGSNNLV
jgi:hypothetical protein